MDTQNQIPVNSPENRTLSSNPSIPPDPPPQKSKLPLVLVILILLVIISIGGIKLADYIFGFSAQERMFNNKVVLPTPITKSSPTPDPTANWKTYTNTKYGYSLKYPNDWTVTLGVAGFTGDDANLETVYQIKLNSKNISEERLMVWVWVKKSFYTNINEFSKSLEISKSNTEKMQVDLKEKTLLSGVEALKYTRSQPGVGKVLDVTTINNGYEYTLNLDQSDTQPQNIPIFDQILSTFKFLDQTQTDSSIKWITYSNKEYGFSFQYLSDMTVEEDKVKEPNYDLLAEFSMENYGLNVKAIYDIDIYNKVNPRNVAEREIVDSGFEYDLFDLNINNLQITKTLVNDGAHRAIATIAHPSKNLFIQLTMSGTKHQFDDYILKSFKFL